MRCLGIWSKWFDLDSESHCDTLYGTSDTEEWDYPKWRTRKDADSNSVLQRGGKKEERLEKRLEKEGRGTPRQK